MRHADLGILCPETEVYLIGSLFQLALSTLSLEKKNNFLNTLLFKLLLAKYIKKKNSQTVLMQCKQQRCDMIIDKNLKAKFMTGNPKQMREADNLPEIYVTDDSYVGHLALYEKLRKN